VTRVDFHFNAPDKIGYGCRLLRKVYRSGRRAVVYCDDGGRLARLDEQLWTFSPLDFIPHVLASDRLAPRTPIVLTAAAGDTPHHEVLINLGEAMPPFFSRFERLIEVVTAEPDDRDRARERFRFYKDRGYPLETHDLSSDAGRRETE
jgi:DNA polymerase III subunit chi